MALPACFWRWLSVEQHGIAFVKELVCCPLQIPSSRTVYCIRHAHDHMHGTPRFFYPREVDQINCRFAAPWQQPLSPWALMYPTLLCRICDKASPLAALLTCGMCHTRAHAQCHVCCQT